MINSIFLDETVFYGMNAHEMVHFVRNELNYANRFGKEIYIELPADETEKEGSEFNKFFLDSFMIWTFDILYKGSNTFVLAPVNKIYAD